jgi:hypothetical protein
MSIGRNPDFVASVRFYPTEEGGRESPTPDRLFRCPLEFEGERFDCGLLLDEVGPLEPGMRASVPVSLRAPQLLKARLRVGSRFTLWEQGTIAEGTVEEIVR